MKRSAVFLLLVFLMPPAVFVHGAPFKRGDANASDKMDLSDAVFTLNFLFTGSEAPSCLDAADTNDDGKVDISDGVSLLGFLFLGQAEPKAPFPDCGADPTDDDTSCDVYPHCVSCFGQAELDEALAGGIAPIVCIPAGSVETLVVGSLLVTVCPTDLAAPCPAPDSPDLGCPVEFTQVQGTLDVPGRTVKIHIQGQVVDLPIRVVDTTFGSTTDCKIDIAFEGDILVNFTVTVDGEGNLTIGEILNPYLSSDPPPDITLSTDGTAPFICKTIVNLQALFIEQVIAQLEAAAGDLLAGLKAELAGKQLCPARG